MPSVPTDRPKRAAVYVRVSSKHQEEEGTSLSTQEAGCRRYVAERGWTFDEAHLFREVHTGVELWERAQLSRLRDLIRHGAIDVVVAYSIDRLSRDPVHLGVVVSEADHRGVAVEFVIEPLDTSPEGELIRFVRGYAAKIDHEKRREATMRGRHERVERGKLMPGCKPRYGYLWNADRTGYVVDVQTASIVRRIKDEYLSGVSLRRICIGLNADKVPPPTQNSGGGWYPFTVRGILTDPIYWGEPRTFRKRLVKGHGKNTTVWRPLEEQIALPSSVAPALFTADDAAGIATRMAAAKRLSSRNSTDPEASLLRGGFVRCALCGCTMLFVKACQTVTRQGTPTVRQAQYRCEAGRHGPPRACRQTVGAEALDAAVWRRVTAVLSDPDVLAREVARLQDDDPTAHDLAALDKTLATVDRRIGTLVEQLADVPVGSAVAAAVKEKLAQLETTRTAIGAERERLGQRVEEWRAARGRLGGPAEWQRRVAAKLPLTTYQDRRHALVMLGVRVRVWPKDHPDRPADADRYVIEANVPLDGPETAAVASKTRCGCHCGLSLRWSDRD